MNRRTLKVGLGERSYDIVVGPGLLSECGDRVASVLPPPRTLIIITNDMVSAVYGDQVKDACEQAGFTVSLIEMPVGERYKSLSSADQLYGRLLEIGADRSSAIIALGGGVTGDLAGFVAATYMRGIPFVQIPTSLLAQVDSSVGGKTAVNHPQAKNIIGSFYQPRLVIIDPDVLSTLPPREFRAGLSEIVKYALIAGGSLLDLVRAHLPFQDGADALADAIVAGCAYKAEVVEADEFDTGRRAVLNYGHTIGHAIEAVAGYQRSNHGEAVAVGMMGAAMIAERLSMLSAEDVDLHRQLLDQAGLPTTVTGVDPKAIFSHLQMDKKRVAGRDHMVLLDALGDPRVLEVDAGLIKETIDMLAVPSDFKGKGEA